MPDMTFYWHDYETSGVSPSRDRPLQFAGIRTDAALNKIDDPLMIYCKPPRDVVPSPEASLITGITPQHADQHGLVEAEFMRRVHHELATPGTCGVGYNSIRFDDEVTRFGLYRNFHDPYAREWQNGCSRWDIIDLARMTAALRPGGIEWPRDEEGKPSFRLEKLTEANGIGHTDAHDALSDVEATIALARLLKQAQPKLFEWLLRLRNKHEVTTQLDLSGMKPLVHTTRMYPSSQFCTSLVVPLGVQSRDKSAVVLYDLRFDPGEFLDLDHDALGQRLFTPRDELGEGQNRLPVKSMKVNRCPAIAPVNTLDTSAAARIQLDQDQCARHRETLLKAPSFAERVIGLFDQRRFDAADDVDHALYDGFITGSDRKVADAVRQSTPDELASHTFQFTDKRLPELLFRYRARNWPETLNETELGQWQEHCMARLQDEERGLEPYFEQIASLRGSLGEADQRDELLDQLEAWGDTLLSSDVA